MTPINSPFDFNHDGTLDAAEQYMEFMIFQNATEQDEEHDDSEDTDR